MPEARALDHALELARNPSLAKAMRHRPLPSGVLDVIKVAALGPREDGASPIEHGDPRRALHEAAVLYLFEMLFFPGADHYRRLGVNAGASRDDMRRHMHWLLRWLHPDQNPSDYSARLTETVLDAWRAVGSPQGPHVETRWQKPRRMEEVARARPSSRRRGSNIPWIAMPVGDAEKPRGPSRLPMLAAVTAGVVFVLTPVGVGESLTIARASRPMATSPAALPGPQRRQAAADGVGSCAAGENQPVENVALQCAPRR